MIAAAPSRPVRAVLALLFLALAAGIPVHAHAEHDGEGTHVGSPDHAHGVALVQHDMRMERPSPPVFALIASSTVVVPVLPARPSAGVQREEPNRRSRAPPPCRPRAPPA